MTRTLAAALAVALTVSVAAAQPAHAPVDAPMTTNEKAATKLDNNTSAGRAPSVDDEREASIDFAQGNSDLNNGLFLQAVDRYYEALVHWDHPAIHYNLALALINLDRPLEVYDHLNKAMAFGPQPIDLDKYNHAKEYLRLVEGQLGDIEVSCNEPGARVAVDGKAVFTASGVYTAKVRIGIHSFLADKPGYIARSVSTFVGPGTAVRTELLLYTTQELTRYRRKWNRAWLPYGVIGAGALVGLVGGGVELWASSSFKNYDAAVARCSQGNTTPNGNGGCDASASNISRLRNSGNLKQTAGFVAYGVGGAAIAVGVVLAYVNRREVYQISVDELTENQVSVTPMVAPGIAGALIQARF